jgi:hypothetical protein
MARLISQTGLPGSQNIGSPQEGTKWVVKWALVVLHTSTTTGSRAAAIEIARAGIGPNLLTIAYVSGSGTSNTYYGVGDITNNGGGGAQLVQFYGFPEVFAVDIIQLNYQGLSGDTVDYYIMVEEEAS